MEKKTVAVGMSGGVDSSTVAYMLKKEGYNVIGITMKHWGGHSDSVSSKTCCTLDDIIDAKRVCDDLEIPHYTINYEEEFKKEVVEYFISEYQKSRTPNPCMVCNRKVKLGLLVDFAKKIGADYLATGHYSIIKDGKLYKGEDLKKDQAYFLAQVKKENIPYLMFPLGNMQKTDVRELAKELGVRTYSKKDSQEICFIENDDYKSFLMSETDGKIEKKGNIVKEDGTVVGKHNGLAFYTIGQRKGMGISHPTPLYVIGFDTAKNELIVGDNDKLFSRSLICDKINIMSVESVKELDGVECVVKTRSTDRFHKAKLSLVGENRVKVDFEEDVRAITPGQGAVFYGEDGIVIGSGYIVK